MHFTLWMCQMLNILEYEPPQSHFLLKQLVSCCFPFVLSVLWLGYSMCGLKEFYLILITSFLLSSITLCPPFPSLPSPPQSVFRQPLIPPFSLAFCFRCPSLHIGLMWFPFSPSMSLITLPVPPSLPPPFPVSSPVELLISQTLCWVHDDLDQVDFSSYLLKVCGQEEVLQKWVYTQKDVMLQKRRISKTISLSNWMKQTFSRLTWHFC